MGAKVGFLCYYCDPLAEYLQGAMLYDLRTVPPEKVAAHLKSWLLQKASEESRQVRRELPPCEMQCGGWGRFLRWLSSALRAFLTSPRPSLFGGEFCHIILLLRKEQTDRIRSIWPELPSSIVITTDESTWYPSGYFEKRP